MVRKPPAASSVVIALGLIGAFIVWTGLVASFPPLRALDVASVANPPDPASPLGQIAAAFALLTLPLLLYTAVLGVALWAGRHRLRNLAAALVIVAVLGWFGNLGIQLLLRRPRPDVALDLLSARGWSYPAGPVSAAVACTIAVGATFVVTRQSRRAKIGWGVASVLIVLAVAFDRWLLGANYLSDLVGGVLFGSAVTTVALIGASVTVMPPFISNVLSRAPEVLAVLDADRARRCAVVYNPSKVTDWVTFRRHVEYELSSRGWDRALWLETTPEDSGRAMTARAVEERVDLVLGAGGDGTIRVVCSGLADTGIPFGLIPAGTGNLLARNIGIPLDEREALTVAFDGVDKAIDLVRIAVDDKDPDHFMVMAGIGIDAVIMQSTNQDLKKMVGSAAYFVSAARSANHPALQATIQIDDQPPLRRRAHVIVIGNVGYLQANIPLIPDARPDDGLLDVLIASPRGVADWVRLTTRVLTRRERRDAQLDRLIGRRVTISVQERDHFQLDGDTVGECNTMVAEVVPGGLIIRVPR